MWIVRRTVWNWFSIAKFHLNRRRVAPKPKADGRIVASIPLSTRYSHIGISRIPVADHVPEDERNFLALKICKFQAFLYRVYPPSKPRPPQIDRDPHKAIAQAYTRRHRRRLPAPELPEEYAEPVDLGQLAVAGPYACYLQSCDGGYEWDFTFLGKYEHHHGLRSLGCRVFFRADEAKRKLSADQIECDLGVIRPGTAMWGDAQKIALSAATNHLSLIRHFNWIHLVAVSNVAMATRNQLPFDHAVRRLLWPHVWGTQYSNELVTEILLMKGGDFESVFSFTHQGLCDLFEDSYEQYDIRVMNPTEDAKRRGIVNPWLELPYLQNRQAHYDVFYAHTDRYLKRYYDSDERIRDDRHLMAWVDDLARRIPAGLRDVMEDAVTLDGVARLIAGFIYLGSVEHEVLGTALWHYQLWSHVQPTRIYESGRRESIDVYQRLVNYNFILNVRRSALCSDFSRVALDAAGRDAFGRLLEDLEALQETLDAERDKPLWKVSPRTLESGVNG